MNRPDSTWWALSKEDVKVRGGKIQRYSKLQQTRNWIQPTTWMSLEADSKLQRRTLARMTFSLQFLWDGNLHWHRQHIKKQRDHFADESPYSQSCGFSSSHVQMWELDHKENWVLKNWCFQIVVLEKTLESPLDCKIKPVNPKGNQSWIFIGRTDAKAETPNLWPPDVKSWLRKDPDAEKDWGQKEKGVTEDEMVGWHHWLNGHEFEQTPVDSTKQGSQVCCSSRDHKESGTAYWLKNNKVSSIR